MTEGYGCPFCGAARKRLCKHRIKWYQNYDIMARIESIGMGILAGAIGFLWIITKWVTT